jgi:repressor LexA
MIPLTSTQRRTLNQLQKLRAEGGYEPSYRELAKSLGLASPASVHIHLKTLEAKGYLRRDSNGHLVPVQGTTHAAMTLPVRWKLSGGKLEPVAEHEVRAIPSSLASSGECSLYLVEDGSYLDMHIVAGDCLVVEDSSSARNNDTVVATADSRTVVRRYQRDGNTYRLQPLDPNVAPLLVERIEVLGIVRGLIRAIQ